MMTLNSPETNLEYLSKLASQLQSQNRLEDKINYLYSLETIQQILRENLFLEKLISSLNSEHTYALLALLSLGQKQHIFYKQPETEEEINRFHHLLDQTYAIESFYESLGGIVGYHKTVIQLIDEAKDEKDLHDQAHIFYSQPPGIKLDEDQETATFYTLKGIQNLPLMGEIYPIGGAGERLDLRDQHSHKPLPTAKLNFLGKTLLEGLFLDLQGKEYLYYKLHQKQITTPVALMTSHAKNNDLLVHEICEKHGWFGRDPSSIRIFLQPSVPVIAQNGAWSILQPYVLNLKPSGHGVLWKLAEDQGIFKWFYEQQREFSIIRQINNPVGGTDQNLFALTGLGCDLRKAFGFLSCPRYVHASEGMNILIEEKLEKNLSSYTISNIEYTDFIKKGIEDEPVSESSEFSLFPANTNILFAHLPEIEKALKKCAIPGLLVNLKKTAPVVNENGTIVELPASRLESTMQNIADFIPSILSSPLQDKDIDSLKTFLIYNKRQKTISVTKRSYEAGKPLIETPAGCLYDLLSNNHHLLQSCGFELPSFCIQEEFIQQGPNCLFTYHPGLGPLYSIIQQKLKGKKLFPYAEWRIGIPEIDCEQIVIDGSVIIESDYPLGHRVGSKVIYSHQAPKCTLKNVSFTNKGIDRKASNVFWEDRIERHEKVKITLSENSEFIAENVHFQGSYNIDVPPNTCIQAYQQENQVLFKCETIEKPSWTWAYKIKNNAIQLEKTNLKSYLSGDAK